MSQNEILARPVCWLDEQNKHEPRCCVGHTFSSAAILLLRFSVLLTDCEQVLELWMSSGLPRNFSFCFKFFMIYSRMRKKHRSPEVGAEITSIFTTVGLWMFCVYSLMSGWCCASSLDSKSVCSLRVGLSASDTNADVWWGDTVHYTDAGPETTGLCCPFRLWWFENRLPAPELWSKPNMQRSTVVYRCVCVCSPVSCTASYVAFFTGCRRFPPCFDWTWYRRLDTTLKLGSAAGGVLCGSLTTARGFLVPLCFLALVGRSININIYTGALKESWYQTL